MKVLLDEDLPQDLRHFLVSHDVFTVRYMRWDGLKNGELLRTADAAGFQVLLTADQSIDYQQNRKTRVIGLIALSTLKLPILILNVERSLAAIGRTTRRSYEFVSFDNA